MDRTVDTLSEVTPSATPNAAEMAAWQDLPRDEQKKRLRAVLTHPDCATPSTADMSDIRRRAQAATDTRRG